MAHHKRRRPKHRRAGCLLCKPHKDERVKDCKESQTQAIKRALQDERDWKTEHDSNRCSFLATGIICKIWGGRCTTPELCQNHCFDEDLV